MEYEKQTYLKIIASLIGMIILLILFIDVQPPKIEAVEVVKEVEVIEEKIVEVEKAPVYKHSISSVEREMLARLVYLEANTENLECQMAVASVVINRWLDGRWGNTIAGVIYSPYQFSPAGLIHKTTPTETNYVAVDHILKSGSILPKYCMYFRSEYCFSDVWDGYARYAQIGDMYFGYFVEDKGE
jgi:spore germination cell wall hydrolase CwlJ-like protein